MVPSLSDFSPSFNMDSYHYLSLFIYKNLPSVSSKSLGKIHNWDIRYNSSKQWNSFTHTHVFPSLLFVLWNTKGGIQRMCHSSHSHFPILKKTGVFFIVSNRIEFLTSDYISICSHTLENKWAAEFDKLCLLDFIVSFCIQWKKKHWQLLCNCISVSSGWTIP